MDDLQHTRNALIRDGASTDAVDQIVSAIASSPSLEHVEILWGQLECEANRLGWPFDRDYAALALQYSSLNASPSVGKEMLKFAPGRAEWCATAATSGGEGLARSRHVNELHSLLRSRA